MEKHEISADLVHRVLILLKKEANFESFNSDDHSFDSLASSFLEEAIAGSSPSVDVLRCKNCRGELLRGSESIICVYCGNAQLQDFVPEPISFKSTSAFQWFLKSLDLDGNESVGIPLGGTQSGDRGQSSVKEDEILLSDFLDLQLKWLDNSRGFGVKNEELPGKRYSSLIGIDIEEILTQESRDHTSSASNLQGIASPDNLNEEFETLGERKLSLFENTQSSEAAPRSGEGENDESFSDWGAEFQSAIPGPGPEKVSNISVSDASSGSTLTISSNNNIWSNLEPGPPFNSKVSDGNLLVEGDGKAFESANASFDWLPDHRDTTREYSVENEKRDGDDSFDEWGEFNISVSNKITQCEPSNTAVPDTDSSGGLVTSDPVNDFTGSIVSSNIQLQTNNLRFPDDAWNNFTMPSTGGNIQSQTISDNSDQHVVTGNPAFAGQNDLGLLDGIYFSHQDTLVENSQNKVSEEGDPIGLWIDDIQFGIKSGQLQGGDSKSHASKELDSFGLWNDFKGSDNQQQATNSEVADTIISTEGGSTFDAWNDFAGHSFGRKEERDIGLKVVGVKENGNRNDLVALCNDNSNDLWSDFKGYTGGSDNKAISNDISSGAWNDFSSLLVTHTNQPQTSNTSTSDDQAVLEDDNIFNSWPEFRSSGVQTKSTSLQSNDTKASSNQVSFQKAPSSLNLVEDNSTFSSWGDLGGTASILEQQLHAAGAGSSENKLSNGGDGFLYGLSNIAKQSSSQPADQLQCHGVTIFDDKSTCENDDLFDSWTDFTSSSTAQTSISSSVKAPIDKEAVQHGNLFDAWKLIDNSPNVQADKDIAVSVGQTPETNLLSTNIDLQYVGPNSSLQPDLCAGMSSSQNGLAPVALLSPEVPDLARMEHGDVKADGYVDRLNPSGMNSKETLGLKSADAETLISEMHNLSFMLESGLSIPNSDT